MYQVKVSLGDRTVRRAILYVGRSYCVRCVILTEIFTKSQIPIHAHNSERRNAQSKEKLKI